MTRWMGLGFLLLFGCDQTGSWAGDWSGTVAGHAQFSGTWERDPYCEGEVSGTVDSDGFFAWTGDCVVVWGSDEGRRFDVVVDGFVQDVSYTLGVELVPTDDSEEGFDAAFGSGDMSDPLVLDLETDYSTDDEEEAAFIVVEAAR